MKIVKLSLLFLLLSLLMPAMSMAVKVEYRDVNVNGIGPTLQDAINSGLIEAVGRVNGKSIDAVNQINKISKKIKIDGKSKKMSKTEIQREFKEATKGVISSYEVISQGQKDNGMWEVNLKAKIAKFKLSKDANRMRIAVMPLRVGDKPFNLKNGSTDKPQLADILSQEIISGLTQSRRITVLDRDYLDEAALEKNLVINSITSSIEDIARLGQALVVDYMIVGTIEDLSYSERDKIMQSNGRKIRIKEGSTVISYRIIDISTQQIKFADSARFTFNSSDLSSVQGNKETAILALAAKKMITKILNSIYPILVVSTAQHTVTLNQGGDLINVGDIYNLYKYGRKMMDPYTKESLGREEHLIGKIKIKTVNPKFSIAEVLTTDIDLVASFQPISLVCRFNSAAPTKSQIRSKKSREKRKKRNEKRETEW